MADMKKRRKLTKREKTIARAIVPVAMLFILLLLTAGNLVRIMIINGEDYKKAARNYQLRDTVVAADRGTIYDAKGNVLAKSASVWKIYVKPNLVPNDEIKNFIAKTLSVAFDDVSAESIVGKIEKGGTYQSLKGEVELAEKEKVRLAIYAETSKMEYYTTEKNEDGVEQQVKKVFHISDAVGIDPDVKRYYTDSTLAATVLGFTGDQGTGRSGLEYYYEDTLAGKSGRIITAKNAVNGLMGNEYETVYDAEQGTSLVLTIDSTIQRYLREELMDVYEDSQGVGAYGIVMDVNTGAILALSCVPGFAADNPYALTEAQKAELEAEPDEAKKNALKQEFYERNRKNYIVSSTYEPGSVFKTVVAAAALEEGTATEATQYTCVGSIHVAGHNIHCHNHDGHGLQTLRKGLMNSCNPFFITLGQGLGKEKFLEYFEAFGFMEKTGVDLPGEPTPNPVDPENRYNGTGTYYGIDTMGISELSSASFGQSFEVTPLQMVTALSAIANGGKLVTPYVVDSMLDDEGNVISKTEPVIKRQVISESTAQKVTDMMVDVVAGGTGKNAYVEGYSVAGKTGTSEKLGKDDYYVASFGCFAPSNDPEIAVLIMVDEPVGQINGGAICTPVAARVVEKTLEYMNVERMYTSEELKRLDKTTPNIVGQSIEDAREQLESDGFKVKVAGNGDKVISQMPAHNASIANGGVVVLYTDSDERITATVPDLMYLSVTQATSSAVNAGVNIKVVGNSSLDKSELVSYEQSINPGNEVEYGSTVTVYFKSNSGVSDYSE